MSSFYSDLMTHRYHLVKFIFAEHQRTLLFVLITCVTIFSMLLTSYSIYLSYLFYDPTTTTSGNKNNNNGGGNSSVLNWIGLAVVGICLMTTCIIGLRGTHIVNLDLLLTFFWGVMIFIGPFILAIVVGFDFFLFLSIYFDHGWNTSTFRGIREIFCHPSSYADTLCAVPYQYATNRASVNSWCLTNYNSTDCYDTYNQAFNNSLRTASSLILIQTIISVINLGILLVTIFIVFRMLTSPVIAESMNDVVNYLLVLPIGAGFGMTWYLWNWQSLSGVPYSWSPVMFLVTALALVIALPLGVVAGRRKSQILLTIYIITMILITTTLAVLGSFGIVYSGLFKSGKYTISNNDLSEVACYKELSGCCCCNYNASYLQATTGGNKCPEWSANDIYSYIGLDFELSGATALISILYLIGAIVVALVTRISLKNYKTDYI